MRKDEIVRKNISLVFDFLRYLAEHPEMIDRLPDGCELEFLDKDLPLFDIETGNDDTQKAVLRVHHVFELAPNIS